MLWAASRLHEVLQGKPLDNLPQEVLVESQQQHMEMLLYQSLQDSKQLDILSPQTHKSLHHRYQQLAFLELMREQKLSAIQKACLKKGFEPLLMKGTALAYTHYACPVLRERTDMDILIPLDQIECCIGLLQSLGFKVHYPRYKSHQFTASCFVAKNIEIFLDVHWRVSNHSAYALMFSYEELLSSAIPIKALEKMKSPCMMDALMISCMNLSVNELSNKYMLLGLYDNHLLWQTLSEIDKKQLLGKIKAKGISTEVGYYMQLMKRLVHPESELSPLFENLTVMRADVIKSSYLGLLVLDIWQLPRVSRGYLLKELLSVSNKQLEIKGSSRYLPLFIRYILHYIRMLRYLF